MNQEEHKRGSPLGTIAAVSLIGIPIAGFLTDWDIPVMIATYCALFFGMSMAALWDKNYPEG